MGGLDWPLLGHLDCIWISEADPGHLANRPAPGTAKRLFGAGGMVPRFATRARNMAAGGAGPAARGRRAGGAAGGSGARRARARTTAAARRARSSARAATTA